MLDCIDEIEEVFVPTWVLSDDKSDDKEDKLEVIEEMSLSIDDMSEAFSETSSAKEESCKLIEESSSESSSRSDCVTEEDEFSISGMTLFFIFHNSFFSCSSSWFKILITIKKLLKTIQV